VQIAICTIKRRRQYRVAPPRLGAIPFALSRLCARKCVGPGLCPGVNTLYFSNLILFIILRYILMSSHMSRWPGLNWRPFPSLTPLFLISEG